MAASPSASRPQREDCRACANEVRALLAKAYPDAHCELNYAVSAEQAAEAARAAALNAIAAAADVAGGLDAIKRIVRVVVFVNSAPDFTGQAGVANGASQLLGQVFGEHGRHARSAVGVATLPLGSAVEVELTVEV